MVQTKRDFDKDRTFQERFIEQYRKKYSTHEQMAKAFGVSRPTISGWFNGTSTPSIHVLIKIAQHFNVSTDYLLGLSDTASPSPTLRSAVEYTGLSEAAVEHLHIGLINSGSEGFTLPEKEKGLYLETASKLIQSDAFTKIIHHLNEVSKEAYLNKIMLVMIEQYFETTMPVINSKFHYKNEEERNLVIDNLRHVLKMKGTKLDKNIMKKVPKMDDQEISINVYGVASRTENANDLHQFHAAKALNSYIDQLVEENYKKAAQQLES